MASRIARDMPEARRLFEDWATICEKRERRDPDVAKSDMRATRERLFEAMRAVERQADAVARCDWAEV